MSCEFSVAYRNMLSGGYSSVLYISDGVGDFKLPKVPAKVATVLQVSPTCKPGTKNFKGTYREFATALYDVAQFAGFVESDTPTPRTLPELMWKDYDYVDVIVLDISDPVELFLVYMEVLQYLRSDGMLLIVGLQLDIRWKAVAYLSDMYLPGVFPVYAYNDMEVCAFANGIVPSMLSYYVKYMHSQVAIYTINDATEVFTHRVDGVLCVLEGTKDTLV